MLKCMQLWKAEMFLCYGLSFPLNRSREEKPSWAPTCSLVVYSLRSVFVVVPDNKFVLLVFVRSERHQIRNGGSNGLLNSTGIAKNRALFSDGTSRVLQSADQHKSVRHNQDTVTRVRCANSEAGVKWAEGQRMVGVARRRVVHRRVEKTGGGELPRATVHRVSNIVQLD
jgi:hypothetical protein